MDHDLPPGSHVAAVEHRRKEALKRASQSHRRGESHYQQGDDDTDTRQQTGEQPRPITDWASI